MSRPSIDNVYVALRNLVRARLASPATRQQAARVLAGIEKETVVKLVLDHDIANGIDEKEAPTKAA